MTHTFTNPEGVRAPSAPYSHSVEVPPGERTLYVAGQVGYAPDGSVPEGIAAQTEQVFANLDAVLGASGYGMADVVALRVYLVHRDDREGFNVIRRKHLGDHRPASTLVFVAGLAAPHILVEIEAIACRSR